MVRRESFEGVNTVKILHTEIQAHKQAIGNMLYLCNISLLSTQIFTMLRQILIVLPNQKKVLFR